MVRNKAESLLKYHYWEYVGKFTCWFCQRCDRAFLKIFNANNSQQDLCNIISDDECLT